MTTPDLDALLARMSPADKLAQLQILWRRDEADALALARAGIGALFWPQSAEKTNALQRAAVEESAHGIPLLIGLDVVHGQFTIFPTPLAQAASFDLAVAEADALVSATEARSGGVTWTFSPMVDVTRDPRWGRVVEGFGEDSFLTSAFGAAKVRGYQGDDLSSSERIASCLKHFVAYGAAEGGRDYNTTDMSWRRLRETYLTPFRAGVDAGAATVMASFNSLNGTPMHANRRLLTEVLSDEYGFGGVVVGDADGVLQLAVHGVAADEVDAIGRALSAGLDVVMGGIELTADGEPILDHVSPARIDDAVLRILRLKRDLGLFENPYTDAAAERSAPTSDTLDEALHAAERCPVLLKNDGGLLPIADEPRRILLTGPYARSTDHLGAWVQHFGAAGGHVVRRPRRAAAPGVVDDRRRGRLPRAVRPADRGGRRASPQTTTSSSSPWASRARSPARPARAATSVCRATRPRSSAPSRRPACPSSCCWRADVPSSSRTGSTMRPRCCSPGTSARAAPRRSPASSRVRWMPADGCP